MPSRSTCVAAPPARRLALAAGGAAVGVRAQAGPRPARHRTVRVARRHRPRRAGQQPAGAGRGRLEAALAVWRGPALADVSPATASPAPKVARLEEARRATEEDRLDAELAAGRSDRAAAMAEALTAAEPFRERRWGQLMLALYRSVGRPRPCAASSWWATCSATSWASTPARPCATCRKILTHDPGWSSPTSRHARRPRGRRPAGHPLHPPRRVRPRLPGPGRRPHRPGVPPGFTGHLEIRWEDPTLSRLFRRLAASSRLVLLDKRGTGMSDRAGATLRSPSTWTTSSP